MILTVENPEAFAEILLFLAVKPANIDNKKSKASI